MRTEFVELVTGSIKNRNHIVSIGQAHLNEERLECYRSLFRFDQGLAVFVERTGSTAGYKGIHSAEGLLFDFDGETDLEAVKSEVVAFVEASAVNYDIPQEYWRLSFSGAKGFHAFLPINACGNVEASESFVDTYRAVCCKLVSGFAHADTGIYCVNRLMRMTGSINGKTGLYKIPVTLSHLKTRSIDEIKSAAKCEQVVDWYPLNEIEPVGPLVALWRKHAASPEANPEPSMQGSCLLAPAKRGERNTRAISICGYLIEHGMKEPDTKSILEMWNSSNAEPLPRSELLELVRGAYSRYRKPVDAGPIEIYTLADGEKEYVRNIDTLEHEKVRFGLPQLDKRIRGFTAGMVCSIVAKSSNGKSSFLQKVILKQARQSKMPVIFFSLEMPLALDYERVLQFETGLSGYEIEQLYINDRASIKARSALIQADLPNFFLCTRCGITVEDIAEVVNIVEQMSGQHVSLIGIDYISLLDGKGKDVFEKTSINALALKQAAKNLSVPIIFLVQTTKSNTMYDELDENAGKDAGAILEASDFQLALWREREDENDMDLNEWIDFTLRLTKNRNGQQGAKFKVRMNKISLRWEERLDANTKCGTP